MQLEACRAPPCTLHSALWSIASAEDISWLWLLWFSLVFSACLIIVNVKSFFFLGLCGGLRYGFQIAICTY